MIKRCLISNRIDFLKRFCYNINKVIKPKGVNKLKKLFIFLLTILIVGCSSPQKEVINGYTETSVQEFIVKHHNKDDFILVFTSNQCSHCRELTNHFKSEENLENVFYIEMSTLNNEDKKRIKQLFPDLTGTPTMLKFEDGEMKDILIGYDKEKVTKFLQK